MYQYTASGELNKKQIVEKFDDKENVFEICIFKDDKSVCLNYNNLNPILQAYSNITDKINERIELAKENDYSVDNGKFISGKGSLYFYNSNVEECKEYCNEEEWCNSFSFNYKSRICTISNVNKLNNELNQNNNFSHFEKLK